MVAWFWDFGASVTRDAADSFARGVLGCRSGVARDLVLAVLPTCFDTVDDVRTETELHPVSR